MAIPVAADAKILAVESLLSRERQKVTSYQKGSRREVMNDALACLPFIDHKSQQHFPFSPDPAILSSLPPTFYLLLPLTRKKLLALAVSFTRNPDCKSTTAGQRYKHTRMNEWTALNHLSHSPPHVRQFYPVLSASSLILFPPLHRNMAQFPRFISHCSCSPHLSRSFDSRILLLHLSSFLAPVLVFPW